MPNRYTIRIQNNSGRMQRYAFFAAKPTMSGSGQPQLWQIVFASVGGAPGQTTTATINQQYFAICGSSSGRPAEGVSVGAQGTVPVTLGAKQGDGSVTPGSTIPFTVNSQVPQFLPEGARSSSVNAYQINTDNTFTVRDAQQNNYLIGLGGSFSGGQTGPTVAFVPEPNAQYSIQPNNSYFVTTGNYNTGDIIDPSRMGTHVEVDFNRLPNNVMIVNDENGNLTVQV